MKSYYVLAFARIWSYHENGQGQPKVTIWTKTK